MSVKKMYLMNLLPTIFYYLVNIGKHLAASWSDKKRVGSDKKRANRRLICGQKDISKLMLMFNLCLMCGLATACSHICQLQPFIVRICQCYRLLPCPQEDNISVNKGIK